MSNSSRANNAVLDKSEVHQFQNDQSWQWASVRMLNHFRLIQDRYVQHEKVKVIPHLSLSHSSISAHSASARLKADSTTWSPGDNDVEGSSAILVLLKPMCGVASLRRTLLAREIPTEIP